MKYPERISVAVSRETKEKLKELANNEVGIDGQPMNLGTFVRQIIHIFLERVE